MIRYAHKSHIYRKFIEKDMKKGSVVEYGMPGIYEAICLILITTKLVKFMHMESLGNCYAIICFYTNVSRVLLNINKCR